MSEQPLPAVTDTTHRRAETVSLIGLIVQTVLAVFLFVVYGRTGSEAAIVAIFHALGGVPIWFALWLLSRQRRLVAMEAIEFEQLRREREIGGTGGGAIFEVDSEELSLARRRLRWLIRWAMPVMTLVSAGVLIAFGFLTRAWPLVPNLRGRHWPVIRDADVGAGLVLGGAFLAFLLSRYAVGLSRVETWRHLRAGASYLFGNALLLAMLSVCLGLVHFELPIPERVLAVVTRWLMIALGVEFLINFVLDFYRPRAAGEVPRPAFDSRFLAIFSETAGIARSIAEAINYQFGFEVSKTWFYLLIKRSIVPLILFGAACLVAITSLSVVDVGQLAVIERFGRPLADQPIGPGMTVKYPWPIERTYRFDVGQARPIVLGFAEERPHHGGEHADDARPVLWTNREHGSFEEIDILVATPRSELRVATEAELDDGRGRSVPVSIFRAVASVEFRVRDVFAFGYQFNDGAAVLKGIAQRELVRYAASVDQEAFLSVGRAEAAELLHQRIQSEADRLKLGVEILLVRLLGIHPAQEVAEAYQKVVGAEQQRDASTQDALRQRNEILASAVGGVSLAERLAEAIREADALSRSTDPGDRARLEQAEKLRDELMSQASGQVAKLLADASAERARKVNQARGEVEKFRKQLVAYQAAPTYFEWMKYFDTLSRRLADSRKYLLGFDPRGRKVMLILNTEEEERIRFESQ